MSDLVGNPEDRFSHVAAQSMPVFRRGQYGRLAFMLDMLFSYKYIEIGIIIIMHQSFVSPGPGIAGT